MSIRTPSQVSEELALVLHSASVRTGVFTGVALALGFSTWLYAANRVPSLENVARWIWRRLDFPELHRVMIRRGLTGHGEGCALYAPVEA